MKRTILTLCCLTLTFSLSAIPSARAGTKLDGPAIKALLSGKTVTGLAGTSIKFTKSYRANGSYTLIKEGETPLEGKWWIKDDQYCQKRREHMECYTVEQDGSQYNMLDKEGERHTTFTLQ